MVYCKKSINMLNLNKYLASTHKEEACSANSESCQTFKMECFTKTVNGFVNCIRKTLYLKRFAGFWIRLCSESSDLSGT